MEFSSQEHWSVLFLSLGDLPNPEIESRSLALQAVSLPAKPPEKPQIIITYLNKNDTCTCYKW